MTDNVKENAEKLAKEFYTTSPRNPKGIFRNFNGELCQILGIAEYQALGQKMVIYKTINDSKMYAMSWEDFKLENNYKERIDMKRTHKFKKTENKNLLLTQKCINCMLFAFPEHEKQYGFCTLCEQYRYFTDYCNYFKLNEKN